MTAQGPEATYVASLVWTRPRREFANDLQRIGDEGREFIFDGIDPLEAVASGARP